MEYIRFWHILPKILFSQIFLFSTIVLIKQHETYSFINTLINNLMITQDHFWNGFIIVFIILSLSWFILMIQEGIIHLIKLIIRKLFKIIFGGKIKYPVFQLNSYEYAQFLFKNNTDEIINYIRISSLAVPDLFAKYKTSSKNAEIYFEDVKNKFISSNNVDLLFNLTYDTSITQEQANADKYKNNIHLLEFSCVLFIIIIADLFVVYGNLFPLIYLLLSLVFWIVISLYFHKQLKVRYSYYLIWSYLDSFRLGDWATMTDREAV